MAHKVEVDLRPLRPHPACRLLAFQFHLTLQSLGLSTGIEESRDDSAAADGGNHN
jgi:hypothetical protein